MVQLEKEEDRRLAGVDDVSVGIVLVLPLTDGRWIYWLILRLGAVPFGVYAVVQVSDTSTALGLQY